MAGKKRLGQSEVTEGYIVTSPFRDRNDFNKSYEIGEDVSHLEEEILNSLVSRGLVDAPKEDAKAKADAAKAQEEADKLKAEEDAKAKADAETK